MIYGKKPMKSTIKVTASKTPKPATKTKMKMEITRLPDTVVKKPVSKLERAKKMFPKMQKKK